MRAKTTKFKKVMPPGGVHVARLINIIDWGSQVDKFAPEGRPKLELIWELPQALHVFNEDKGEQPFLVDRKYGNTLGKEKKRSDLGKIIESMLGGSIVDTDENPFPLEDLVGLVCQLSISIENDGTYENVVINAAMPLPAGVDPAQYDEYNSQFVFDMSFNEDGTCNFNEEVWNELPKWKQDLISKTPEYAAAISGVDPNAVEEVEEEQVEEEQQLPFETEEEQVEEEQAPPPPPVKKAPPVQQRTAPVKQAAAPVKTGTPGTVKKLVAGQGFKQTPPAPATKVAAAVVKKAAASPVKKVAAPVKKAPVKKFK